MRLRNELQWSDDFASEHTWFCIKLWWMAESELVRLQFESLGGLRYAIFPLLYGDVSIFLSPGLRIGPTPTLRPKIWKKEKIFSIKLSFYRQRRGAVTMNIYSVYLKKITSWFTVWRCTLTTAIFLHCIILCMLSYQTKLHQCTFVRL